MRTFCLIFFVAILVFSGPARSAVEVLIQGDAATIMGSPTLKWEAETLHAVLPEIEEDLRRALGWELREKPRIVLTADPELFEKMTGSRYISAFAMPREYLVAMVIQPARSNPALMRGTLTHELCHLILHENIGEPFLPRWLDEGVCQWVSGSLGEILSGAGVNRNDLEIGRHAVPIRELSVRFPQDGDGLLLAYAESRGFVQYLVNRFGVEGLQGLLHRLKDGIPVDEAMGMALGSSLELLEEDWLQTLRGRRAWLSWLGRHFYDLLFFTAALLTAMAGLRLLVRKRARMTEMEDEEERLPGPED